MNKKKEIRNDNYNDENNINNIHSNEDDIEKIDEESIHSNNSYIKRNTSINRSFDNYDKNQIYDNEDNKDEENGIKENEPKNNLIMDDEEENNISKNENNINDNSQGMKENNY